MVHPIRYGMQVGRFRKLKGNVEADKTYVGGKSRRVGTQTGWENKTPVVSLVQRDGKVRFFFVPNVTSKNLKEVLTKNIHSTANLMTDESAVYKGVSVEFATHGVVNHRNYEYVRGNNYTNTVEGFISII